MRTLSIALALASFSLLVAASPAEARPARRGSGVALGLGADYLVDPEVGELNLTLALETFIARGLTVGARFGALVMEEDQVGAPIDFRLRLRTSGLYLDGLVGPWLLFDSGDTVRLHGAFGFGILSGATSFGVEVGALDGEGMIGLRLAFSL